MPPSHCSMNSWSSAHLNALDDRTIHSHDDAAFFQALGMPLVIGIAGELATVFFVFDQRGKLDESERFVGGAGEFRRQEVANHLAAATPDRFLFRLSVG